LTHHLLQVRAVTRSLHSHLLGRAAALLGGRGPLGYELQVPAQNLARWMEGLERMPRPVFLKVVDLLLSCSGDVRRKGQRAKGGERDAR
jgi:hypothetical protein